MDLLARLVAAAAGEPGAYAAMGRAFALAAGQQAGPGLHATPPFRVETVALAQAALTATIGWLADTLSSGAATLAMEAMRLA